MLPEERELFAATHDADDDGQWQARAESTTALLAAAPAAKASKGYPAEWGLVILLDLGGFVSSEAEVVLRMAAGTATARNAFSEVWVLWQGVAYPQWIAGESAAGTGPTFVPDTD